MNTKINYYQYIIIPRSSSSFGTPHRQWRIYVKSKQQTIPMSVWGGRNDYHGNVQTTCLLPALWQASLNQELSSPPPHPTKEGWSFLTPGETTSIQRMKGWEQGKEEKKIKSIRMQSLEQMWNGEAMFLGGIMYLDLHRLQLSWGSFLSNFLVTLGCWWIEFMHFQEPEPHLEALPNLQHSMTLVFSSVVQSFSLVWLFVTP